MKIGIDIREASGQKTGKGWVVYFLLEALSKINTAQEHQFVLFTDTPFTPQFSLPANFEVKHIPKKGLFWHWQVAKLVRKKNYLDRFLAPTSYIIPMLVKHKCIMIVHDLVVKLFPKGHNKKALLVENFTLSKALQNSLQVVAISNNTKKDLIQFFPKVKNKIEVMPLAAGPDYKEVTDPNKLQATKNKLGLPNNFVLFVGTIEPRKNLEAILFALAKDKDLAQTNLVVAGKKGWGYKEILSNIERLGIAKRVKYLDYMEIGELITLYSLASAFVLPSHYEGFGLPVIEAMQSGCPVVTSAISSLPEVAGEAAVLVDPQDFKSVAGGIKKALKNKETLKNKGLAQAKKFSWEKSARKLLQIITK